MKGHTTVPVLPDGSITFNKLKIMEVSSKHYHQSFCIHFQLEQIDPLHSEVVIPLGDPIKSFPMHVQSRITKRKRTTRTDITYPNIQTKAKARE
jgi:hypothetical protein